MTLGQPTDELTRLAGPEAFRRSSQWSPRQLLALAKWSAAQVKPWAEQCDEPLAQRQYELLELTDHYELWLIHWPTDRGLVLHDHGGSTGAFQVVSGALEETSTTRRGQLFRQNRLGRWEGIAFGPEYIHSVVNTESAPATSVHAYSPRLTSMTFYRDSPAGLVVDRVETDWEGAP